MMYLKQDFNRLQFNHHFVFDQQVDTKSVFQLQPVVHNREYYLLLIK